MTGTNVATQESAREVVSYSRVGIDATAGGGGLAPKTLGDVVAFAQLMARSQHAIPKHLRDNAGACLAVTMQALRWEMDPFAVASKTYNVKDQVAYEAQIVAAAVNTRAPLKTRPRIEFEGEGDNRVCTVTAEFKDGSVHSYVSPKIKDIPTKNSPLWKGDPDQQLGYYSVRSFARRHCPEVLLGVYTPEELEHAPPMRDVTPEKSGVMERLPGGSNGQGFHAEVVENGLGTEQPLPPEEIDAILEGDTIPAHDAETGEVIEATSGPENTETLTSEAPEAAAGASDDETPAGLADGDFDHVEWSGAFVRGLENLDTAEEVNAAWDEAKTKGFVFKVKAKSPDLAKQVADACTARVAAIKAGLPE